MSLIFIFFKAGVFLVGFLEVVEAVVVGIEGGEDEEDDGRMMKTLLLSPTV